MSAAARIKNLEECRDKLKKFVQENQKRKERLYDHFSGGSFTREIYEQAERAGYVAFLAEVRLARIEKELLPKAKMDAIPPPMPLAQGAIVVIPPARKVPRARKSKKKIYKCGKGNCNLKTCTKFLLNNHQKVCLGVSTDPCSICGEVKHRPIHQQRHNLKCLKKREEAAEAVLALSQEVIYIEGAPTGFYLQTVPHPS
jgi:hypothetical protein